MNGFRLLGAAAFLLASWVAVADSCKVSIESNDQNMPGSGL